MPDPVVTGYEPYTARQGDSYDLLALQAYGEERMASIIADANPGLIDILVFDGGEEIVIPTVDRAADPAEVPPWRR